MLCEDNDVPYIYVPSKEVGRRCLRIVLPSLCLGCAAFRLLLLTCPVAWLQELGQAGLTKRPTSCMLVLPKPLKGDLPADDEGKEYKESYEEVGLDGSEPLASSVSLP